MHAKFERLLSKSLTTLEVMAYYLVVHTGPDEEKDVRQRSRLLSVGHVFQGGEGVLLCVVMVLASCCLSSVVGDA